MADKSRIPGLYLIMRTGTIRTPTRRVDNNDVHYLDKSFDFYPCSCRFNKKMSMRLQTKCRDCMMSHSSRISHMKSKI